MWHQTGDSQIHTLWDCQLLPVSRKHTSSKKNCQTARNTKKKNLKARKEKNDYHKLIIIKEAVNLKTILSRQRYKNGNVKEIG